MVRHIIIWELKDELSSDEKLKIKENIKLNLEGLKGKIDGLNEITVEFNGLESSKNADLMLYSTFESVLALKNYAKNPEHNKVADTFVRPFVKHRSCFDFEVL